MHLLFADPKKFTLLPPGKYLYSPHVRFYRNFALCPSFYWLRRHTEKGVQDITPWLMRRLSSKRELRTILCIATGGIGDTLWAMPFIRFLRTKYPKAFISVIVEDRARRVWDNFPYANFVDTNKIHNLFALFENCDEIFDFGGIATFIKRTMDLDPVEACFVYNEYKPLKNKELMRPHLVLTAAEGQAAQKRLEENNIFPARDQIVTISLNSSTPNRDWPISYIAELTNLFIARGFKVIWLSDKDHFAPEFLEEGNLKTGAVNLSTKTNLRECMAIIALSDLFVGPNSSMMVIAASLQTPCVGLFGAFTPKIRTKFYDKFTPIWQPKQCSPCLEHWTECPKGHPAPCMKLITPDLVFSEGLKLIKQYPRKAIEKLPLT